ncbi:hypothetical protein WIS52_16695 [Pseudonocardia nematodicida]|uniref:ARB-07466-like C-terminal domain-containing protein n=1 Tax=Pseudonocardia nematodicida TaxID=1206997 RepID=A0ABV1KCT0_9PSEU
MPRRHPGGAARIRQSPSRPDVHRPHATPDVPARPRRGAGVVGILSSALAGSALVAGHLELGDRTVHLEDLALQAFTGPVDDVARAPGPEPAVTPSFPDGAVRALAEPPPPVDVDAITGGALTAVDDAVRAADEGRTGSSSCTAGTDGFGGVTAATAAAGETLRCMFGVDTVFGVAGRANASDHPRGKALDFMVDETTGEDLAEYARENSDELGISYIIYRQRIDTGDGWEMQEDRGGATANHMDHVHVSFR